MMYKKVILESSKEIGAGVREWILDCGENTQNLRPGQFINIYPKSEGLTLPRPISICDAYDNKLKVVYAVQGKGTKEFSGYAEGEGVRIMYPLGNGYACPEGELNHVLVGGGIGVPPLLFLAKSLRGNVCVILGFKSEPILIEEFKKVTDKVFVVTENESDYKKGTVLDLLEAMSTKGDMYYSCGPKPMLKAVSEYLLKNGLEGQLSLEERMGCGFGACVGCAVKIKKRGARDYENLRLCKDGPVFDYREVVWL